MINDKEDEIKEELFHSLLSRYKIELEMSLKGGGFMFDCVRLLYYKFPKTNFKCGGLYIDFLDWIKTKKQQ